MPRLIDADALMEKAERMYDCYSEGHAVVDAKHITSAPTINPVKHGKWNQHYVSCDEDLDGYFDGRFECSECLGVADDKTDYCPSCGCKMDGDAHGQ